LPAVNRYGRVAQRFLISILQQYGREAPVVLREWAEELEVYVAEVEGEIELSVGCSSRESAGLGFAPIENDL